MTTAAEVNFVLGVINKLLNPKMKKFIRKSLPNVDELLSSKFLDSGKGSLKLKKNKKKNKKRTNRKKGGSPILSLFGSKKSKTLDDVKEKIESGEKLTPHDANILAMATDKLAAATLMNIIQCPGSDIPGSNEVIKVYNGFLEAQEKTLTEFGKIDKEKTALLKAEIEETEQSKFDKGVRDQALTIFETHTRKAVALTSQLESVASIVEKHGKNIEDAKKRNEWIKKIAFCWFALMGFITFYCFVQFMNSVDSAMDRAQVWLSSFQYICEDGPSFFERVAGVAGELRDCKEGLSTPVIGSLVNTISDMITSLAFTAGSAVGMGRLLLFMCALIQFTMQPLFWGFTGYYGIMRSVRSDDREEMQAFKESIETQGVIMKQQREFLKDAEVKPAQIAKFVANEYSGNQRTGTVTQSRPHSSRGLQRLADRGLEEIIEEPIEEGALKKYRTRRSRSKKQTRGRTRQASMTRLRRLRRPRRRMSRSPRRRSRSRSKLSN